MLGRQLLGRQLALCCLPALLACLEGRAPLSTRAVAHAGFRNLLSMRADGNGMITRDEFERVYHELFVDDPERMDQVGRKWAESARDRLLPWHGMAQGMAWDGMGWDGMAQGMACTTQHGTAWQGRAWGNMACHGMTCHGHGTPWHGVAWHGVARREHGTAWHCMA